MWKQNNLIDRYHYIHTYLTYVIRIHWEMPLSFALNHFHGIFNPIDSRNPGSVPSHKLSVNGMGPRAHSLLQQGVSLLIVKKPHSSRQDTDITSTSNVTSVCSVARWIVAIEPLFKSTCNWFYGDQNKVFLALLVGTSHLRNPDWIMCHHPIKSKLL